MLIVQKYGGSSLADADRIGRAAHRVAELVNDGHKLVVVVSAQGDTTDLLLEKVPQITAAPPPRELDAYLASGEQMSAALMAMALEKLGIPTVSLTGWQAGLMTDSMHGDARVRGLRGDRIRQELHEGNTVVVAGFQGVDAAGDITTLGRGGSDTTAVALAAWLKADKCQIFTDVDGIYDRDPRVYPDARRFGRISYGKMMALIENGAQVLHDRSVELAREHGIRVEVLSAFTGAPGTVVGDLE